MNIVVSSIRPLGPHPFRHCLKRFKLSRIPISSVVLRLNPGRIDVTYMRDFIRPSDAAC